ncbi:MAG TPA: zinc ribbon domain-containing protein, partial [Thermoclostridium sp.]|nr:zinc ribbon domain-containing protein [Thermoclostridium sp.]
FNTLLKAAECAVTRCNSWNFATSDDRYDVKGLLVLAETSDSEDPIDEDSFYVVSPAGAIGLCADGEDIDWLFLSDAAPNEDLPLAYQVAAQVKFCPKCGFGVASGARFCEKCGNKL